MKIELERQLGSFKDLAREDMRPAGVDWALEKSRIELEAQMAKMEAATAALDVDIAQLLAVKEEELQEEWVALAVRNSELNQTHYNERLRSLTGSKRYLQQTLSTATIACLHSYSTLRHYVI